MNTTEHTDSTPSSTPDTIVLIHGFWVTPRSWEDWIEHYERRGFKVIAPAYPGFEVEVDALNADPTAILELTVPKIIEHLESVIAGLDEPPILVGHSAGGAFVQILLDRGYGAAGIAISSAPTEGVRATPLTQLKAALPMLRRPSNRRKAVGLTLDEWRYAFTNTFSDDEAARLYGRYHVPASGSVFWGSVLANFQPGHQATWVDYRNGDRAPLLFVSGGADHLMPPAIQRSNARKYRRSGAVTERREYAGMAHLLPADEGWRDVADESLDWALAQVAATPVVRKR